MKNKMVEQIKKILTGRNIGFVDNFIFYISGKKVNGWLLGNKLRNRLYGKRKKISNLSLIFIGGCPRSGTTLLQHLLKNFDYIDGPNKEICLFQDVKNFKSIKKEFEINHLEFFNFLKRSNGDIISLSDFILREYKKKKKLKYSVLKAPKYIMFLGELLKYFPKAKFIHIIRDGRDVSISMKKFFFEQFGERYNFEYYIKTWVVSVNQGKRFRKHKNYLEIKYEDLVKDPEKIMVKISKFLNIKPLSKKEILNFHKRINPEKIVKSHRIQVSQPIYKKRVNRWKKEATNKEKQIMERIASKSLKELGYER